jgi:hypothetical protein
LDTSELFNYDNIIVYSANRDNGLFVFQFQAGRVIALPPPEEVEGGTPAIAIVLPIFVIVIVGVGIGAFVWWKKNHGKAFEEGRGLASQDGLSWLNH